MRIEIQLSREEQDRFDRLRPIQGEALSFWESVAKARNLDPASLMLFNGFRMTGLEDGHGLDWCYPLPLKCKRRPGV